MTTYYVCKEAKAVPSLARIFRETKKADTWPS